MSLKGLLLYSCISIMAILNADLYQNFLFPQQMYSEAISKVQIKALKPACCCETDELFIEAA